MLILMKQHGRTIVCCVIAVLALGMAFGIRVDGYQGFIQIAYGKAMGDMTRDAAGDAGMEAVNAIAARRKPDISYVYQKTLPKTTVNLDAMFSAKDADGNPVDVKITDILDASGKSLLYQTDLDRKKGKAIEDTAGFQFPAVGVYRINVKAVDWEKKAAFEQYQIPVTSN